MSNRLTKLILSSGLIATCFFGSQSHAEDGMVNVSTKGVDFSYPVSMGKKFSAKKVAAVPLASPDDKPDGVAPEHWEITFAKTNAHVYVFPTTDPKVKNFKKAYPTVADATKDLSSLLKNKSAAPTNIPYLPWLDASTPINSKMKYLSFKNGAGVRYIATYQIEPEVVSNDGLLYSMQGLTEDGKYYVSAQIPVRSKTLPEKSDVASWSKEKYDAFSKDFAKYSKKEELKLNKLAESAFSPSLADLDKIVSSIKVQ